MQITEKLIKSCVKNDRRAQERLYTYCYEKWMPLCFRYHRNEENARDILNQSFLKIINSLKKYKIEVSFDAWSRKIVMNTIIDHYRKHKRYKEQVEMRETERELDYFANSSRNMALDFFEQQTVDALINKLPSVTRQVFNLYVIDGYSHKEIGEMLEISDGTSKWHLSNARKILSKLLEKRNPGMAV